MKTIKSIQKLFLFIIITTILGSCASTHDVVSNGIFQKRKYKSGYNVSFKNKIDNKANISVKNNETLASAKTNESTKNNNDVEGGNTESNSPIIDEIAIKPTEAITEKIVSSDLEKNNNKKSKTIIPSLKLKSSTSNIAVNKKPLTKNNPSPKPQDDTMLIIALIVAFFIPPLGVYLAVGKGSEFKIDLILFLIGIVFWGAAYGLFFGLAYIGWLCLFASWIYALYVILTKLL